MPQPIPRKIKENNPSLSEKTFNTLLVDGSNLLELSFSADKRVSSNGKEVGGIFQFLLQLKIMLSKANFRYVYVFWDGARAGQFRFNELAEYKANRDKTFDEVELSDYMKEVNKRIRCMQQKLFRQEKADERKENREKFFWQRDIIMQCLEELFVRQCINDEVEADDFIGYYVKHKKPNERIVIMSNDMDMTQLISDTVIVYLQRFKKFINTKNHTEEIGYNYQNVLLKKILCGDDSDNIKGIKLLGEKTLLNNFKEFTERKVTLEEVIDKARKINEERAKSKKKPLIWAKNIVERITDSSAGRDIYDINRKIIDLSHPLMTDEAEEMMNNIMYAPLDPEGRSMTNLYRILMKNGIDDLKDENRFSNFFIEYQYLIDKEKKNNKI
jgi:5'-3' exonuclease